MSCYSNHSLNVPLLLVSRQRAAACGKGLPGTRHRDKLCHRIGDHPKLVCCYNSHLDCQTAFSLPSNDPNFEVKAPQNRLSILFIRRFGVDEAQYPVTDWTIAGLDRLRRNLGRSA